MIGIPPFPHFPSWSVQGQLYVFLKATCILFTAIILLVIIFLIKLIDIRVCENHSSEGGSVVTCSLAIVTRLQNG
jgi:hypothetical protein